MSSVRELIMSLERRIESSNEPKAEPPPPSKLLELPNELLLLIFFHCEDFKSGVALSATSQRLHDLWLNGKKKITFHLLQKSMPWFDVALELAIEEIKMAEPARILSVNTVFSKEDLGDIILIIRRNHEIVKHIWDTRYAIHTGGFPKPSRPRTFAQVLDLFCIICNHIIMNRFTPYDSAYGEEPSCAKSAVMSQAELDDLYGLMTSVESSMGEDEMSIYGQTDLPFYFNKRALSRVCWITHRYIIP